MSPVAATHKIQLGHLPPILGGKEANIADVNSLTTHCFITGMTGSGKTGNIFVIMEDLVRAGVPVVVLDRKGDMLNIANTRNTAEGRELRSKMAVRLLTPASTHGESVNLLSGLTDRDDVGAAVTALLKLCDIDSGGDVQGHEHNYLTQIIRDRHAEGLPVTLVDLIYAVQEPRFTMIGAMPLEAVFPPAKRMKLAKELNKVMCDQDFESWRVGVSLDFDELLARREDGRTPVIVYQVSHIVDENRQRFALTIALEALVKYMRKSSGTNKLRTMIIIDELAGLIPPHPLNPTTKLPILTLLKQARAFGIGVTLATQNPVDLDYKGLSNMGTWIIGRLRTANDRARVIEGLCETGGYDSHTMSKLLAGLEKRNFVIARNEKPTPFISRDVSINLSGPVSPQETATLFKQGRIEPVDKAAVLFSRLTEARSLYAYDTAYGDRVRALETDLVNLGHSEVLNDSPVHDDGILELANCTGREGLTVSSPDHQNVPLTPAQRVRAGAATTDEEEDEDEVEEQLRKKMSKNDLPALAKKATRAGLYANVTAAKAVRKPALIDALVKHEMFKRALDAASSD